jgi:hypothetical protein
MIRAARSTAGANVDLPGAPGEDRHPGVGERVEEIAYGHRRSALLGGHAAQGGGDLDRIALQE